MIEKINELYKKNATHFEFITGYAPIGASKSIVAGISSQQAENDLKLEYINKNRFVQTANKDYLFLLTDGILEPKPAKTAVGEVIFYGVEGAVIPEGTEIQAEDGSIYTTLVEAVIQKNDFNLRVTKISEDGANAIIEYDTNIEHDPNDENTILSPPPPLASCDADIEALDNKISVVKEKGVLLITLENKDFLGGQNVQIVINQTTPTPVEAVETGSAGNKSFNDNLKTSLILEGVNEDLKVYTLGGGDEFEDTEVFRTRYLHYMANTRAPFNDNDIIFHIKENHQNIKNVWVKGGGGVVNIYALNHDNDLTANEMVAIKESVIEIKEASLSPDNIHIHKPILKYKDISINNLIPLEYPDLINEMRKNLISLYNRDLFEKIIPKHEIELTIFQSYFNDVKVESFDYNALQDEVEENTVLLFNSFEAQV